MNKGIFGQWIRGLMEMRLQVKVGPASIPKTLIFTVCKIILIIELKN